MESTEKKSDSKKKADKKSSASTPDQTSRQDAKESGNERFSEKIIKQNENIQKQMQRFEEIFQRQNEMFNRQNQISHDLMKTLDNVLRKGGDSAKDQTEKEKIPIEDNKGFVLSRSAFRNLAQRNISKEDKIDLSVQVNQSYHDRIREIKSTSEKRKLTY